MKQNKFVIYDNQILFGKVFYHKDLLPDNFDMLKIYGGGLFRIEDDTLYLYGESFDFGRYNQDIVTQDMIPEKIKHLKIVHLDS